MWLKALGNKKQSIKLAKRGDTVDHMKQKLNL
jgi:hypothetical protein